MSKSSFPANMKSWNKTSLRRTMRGGSDFTRKSPTSSAASFSFSAFRAKRARRCSRRATAPPPARPPRAFSPPPRRPDPARPRPGFARLVHADVDQVRGKGHRPLPRGRILGEHADADLERGAPHVLDVGSEDRGLPPANRRGEAQV